MVAFISTNSSVEGTVTTYFTIPFADDIKYIITSNFGTRLDPFTKEKKFHTGVDLVAPFGTDILSSADGVVYKIGYDEESLGNYVYIEHNYQDFKVYSMYLHLENNSIVVYEGEHVTAKQKIAKIGNTGKVTGTHLHFMLSKNKVSFNSKDLLDPMLIINKNT